MPAPAFPKSLAEQIADLDDPAPRDIDPEDLEGAFTFGPGDESGDSEVEEGDARGHYEDVGKGQLRQSQAPVLDKRYHGASVSRGTLGEEEDSDDPFGRGMSEDVESEDDEDGSGAESEGKRFADPDKVDIDMDVVSDADIDSDEAFGEGDEESFKEKGFTFKGSRTNGGSVGQSSATRGKTDEDVDEDGSDSDDSMNGASNHDGDDNDARSQNEDMASFSSFSSNSNQSDLSDASDDASNISSPSSPPAKAENDRAALRAMMAEEQKAVLSTISQAAKADAAKGRAVTAQRSTFSTLLNTRIRMQKALVASNSLPASSQSSLSDHKDAISAAEQAALNLYNALSSLRSSSSAFDVSTPSSKLHTHLSALDRKPYTFHRSTLDKWSQKTHLISSLPTTSRLSNAPTTQPLTSILDTHLAAPNLDRLLARTRISRGQSTPSGKAGTQNENEHIFDDTDFYTLLLRDLVDQKMSSSNPTSTVTSTALPASHAIYKSEAKIRKKVDTKASKGRKMRYQVHEKLQNFMAREDRGSWGERQAAELFGGLLGMKTQLNEGVEDGEDEEGDVEVEGLKLFGGA